jgi:hypothetical protein
VSWDESLGVYLNDHLAGATTGMELAEKLSQNNPDGQLGADLSSLVGEIRTDRVTLEGLMESLGVRQSAVKQAAGWGAEKLTRLKLSTRLTGDPDLTRLLEMETLSIGIEGKLAMWLVLREIAGIDARLAGTDFDRLIERARLQRQKLEPYRLEAAAKAFAP